MPSFYGRKADTGRSSSFSKRPKSGSKLSNRSQRSASGNIAGKSLNKYSSLNSFISSKKAFRPKMFSKQSKNSSMDNVFKGNYFDKGIKYGYSNKGIPHNLKIKKEKSRLKLKKKKVKPKPEMGFLNKQLEIHPGNN